MGAGQRNTPVTLERKTTTRDDYNEEIETWTALGDPELAVVFHGRGSERRQAAVEQGAQVATFQFLAHAKTRSLTLADRLVAFGSPWDIEGIAPDTPKRGEIEITATRKA